MPAVKVRCSNPACRKGYLLKDGSLSESKVCRKCGAVLSLTEEAPQASLETSQAALATATPRGDTAEIAITVSPAASSHPADLETTQRLGRFEIRGKLGEGAFGLVYRAYDPLLSRDLAIKVPQGAALEKPAAVARFLREPKAAAQLRHPHIVPVYDAGVVDGRYYIASAFIEGTTLETASEDRPLDFRQAAKTVLDLAEALEYAHGLGVVHRDIKPANIMFDTRGDALLMDFGLARLEAAEELTHDGAVLGTPAYMAPEQAAGKQEAVGPHSDQYSLGVVLYELLCGRRPFSGPPAIVIFNAIHKAPPAPRSIRPAVPADLETICLKAMAKQPSERYVSCQEFAADLRRWLDDQPIRARQLGHLERIRRWTRHNPVLAALAGVVAALAVISTLAAGALLFSRSQLASAVAQEQTLATQAEEQAKLAGEKTAEAQQQEELAQQSREAAQTETIRALASAKLAQSKQEDAATALADFETKVELRKEAQRQQGDAEREAHLKAEELKQKQDLERLAQDDRAKVEETRVAIFAASIPDPWTRYCKLLQLADTYWKEENKARVLECLAECPPKLRGWEWQFLDSLARGKAEVQTESADWPDQVVKCSNRDGSLLIVGPNVNYDGTVRVKGGILLEMPDQKKLYSELLLRKDCLFSYDSRTIISGEFSSDKGGDLQLFDVASKTNRSLRVGQHAGVVGCLEDGYVLMCRSGEFWAVASSLKSRPPEKRVFAGVAVRGSLYGRHPGCCLSQDGRVLFVFGSDTDDRFGLFFGPVYGEPRYIALEPPKDRFNSDRLVLNGGAANGLAVLTFSNHKRAFLDCNTAELDWKLQDSKAIATWIPLSLSPDESRLLIFSFGSGFLLVDSQTGKQLPTLAFLPWDADAIADISHRSAYDHAKPPRLIANAAWTSFTKVQSQSWQRRSLAPLAE